MLTGSEFQTLGAENRKARDPKDRLWRRTESWWELDERRDLVGSWTQCVKSPYSPSLETARLPLWLIRCICGIITQQQIQSSKGQIVGFWYYERKKSMSAAQRVDWWHCRLVRCWLFIYNSSATLRNTQPNRIK